MVTLFLVQEPVAAQIEHAKENYDFLTMQFLSERCLGELRNEETLVVNAEAYFLDGDIAHAHSLLKNANFITAKAKLLFATCCHKLKKYDEIVALFLGRTPSDVKEEDLANEFGCRVAYVYQSIGFAYSYVGNIDLAIKYLKLAHKNNPFLFMAFKRLCDLGAATEAEQLTENYATSNQLPQSLQTPLKSVQAVLRNDNHLFTLESATDLISDISTVLQPSSAPPSTTASTTTCHQSQQQHPLRPMQLGVSKNLLQPSFGVLEIDLNIENVENQLTEVVGGGVNVAVANTERSRRANNPSRGGIHNRSATQTTTQVAATGATSRINSGAGTGNRGHRKVGANAGERATTPLGQCQENSELRRSTRLTQKTAKENVSGGGGNSPRNSRSRTSATNLKKTPSSETCLTREVNKNIQAIFKIMSVIAKGYAALAQYKCKEALKFFSSLSIAHAQTPFVLNATARAYCELHESRIACDKFEALRAADEGYLDGLEYYCKTLYLIKNESKLISLTKNLHSNNYNHAVTWISMGYSLSLAREHESAIRAFERACQINTSFAYAYALVGIEHIELNNLDEAMKSFRSAMHHDRRCLLAWAGMGQVYIKREKYPMAIHHLEYALEVNPFEAYYMTALAQAYHSCGRSRASLKLLNRATELAPDNMPAHFSKAAMLYQSHRHHEALEKLEELKKINCSEPLIFFLFGKIYQALGKEHLAQLNFNQANHLNPRYASKENIETFNKQYNPSTSQHQQDVAPHLTGSTSSLNNMMDVDVDVEDVDDVPLDDLPYVPAMPEAGDASAIPAAIFEEEDPNDDDLDLDDGPNSSF